MFEWMGGMTTVELAAVVAATSSAGLFVFAVVQLFREWLHGRRLTKAVEAELTGPSWLALRTLETTLREATASTSSIHWSRSIRLDALEQDMPDVPRIAGRTDRIASRDDLSTDGDLVTK